MPGQSVLSDIVERALVHSANHVAVIDGNIRIDYRTLADKVMRCAAGLKAAEIGPGDRVGYLGLNSPAYIILMLAAFRIGAVTVAINWRLVAAEIDYIVADAGIKLLVTDTVRLDAAANAIKAAEIEIVLLTDVASEDARSFDGWISGHEPDPERIEADPSLIALQLYTSGTTGHPKGALLTHGSLTASLSQGARIGEEWSRWGPDDAALVAMPQFHIGGTAWTLQALNVGGTAVLLGKPDIVDIIDTVERYGITKMFAVPSVLNMILAHPRSVAANLSSLRALLYGASPIPLDVLKRSMALFPNARFVQMYGATETSGTIVYLPPEDHDVLGTARMVGCGKPYPDVELRIIAEDGLDCSPLGIGEVLVRSPLVMQGYHRLPEETAKAFDGEWYRSGDAGYLDDDGYLYLVDRVKDMIVTGGENVYPAEVENALHDHPAVRDCAVIGVPDARWGEAVKAVVVLAGDANEGELIAFARERIAAFKAPKSVDFVDELPRNPSGKILKRELRKLYWPQDTHAIN